MKKMRLKIEQVQHVSQFYHCKNVIMITLKGGEFVTYWSNFKERLLADYLKKEFGIEMMVKFWIYQINKNPKKATFKAFE